MNVYPLKARIRAAAAGVTRVDVYDDIGGSDPFFGGGISASDVAGQLAAVKGPIEVHINSGGGDVFDGIAIGQAIRDHKGPVTTHVDGIAASIASVIAQSGGERVMAPGSMMMIHDAFGGTLGNAAEVSRFAQTLEKISDNLAAIYAQRAGGTAESWRGAMKAETWYTADEAVAAGLADRIAGGSAALPRGLDVAAFAPPRIAAALRTLPHAAAPAEPAECCDQCGPGCQCMAGDALEDRITAIVRREMLAAVRAGQQVAGVIQNADKYDTEDRKRMASSGQAMDDGSYPIADAEDLGNAIHAVGRGGADHDAIRRHIIKRAAALGLSSEIPDNWNSDGSMKDLSHTEILALFAGELGQRSAGKE